MSDSHEHSHGDEVSRPLSSERRRPGRIANASPHLIPLLRGASEEPPDDEEGNSDSDLAPAIGIAVTTFVAVLIWTILVLWFIW